MQTLQLHKIQSDIINFTPVIKDNTKTVSLQIMFFSKRNQNQYLQIKPIITHYLYISYVKAMRKICYYNIFFYFCDTTYLQKWRFH